jgi:hypothetical protein
MMIAIRAAKVGLVAALRCSRALSTSQPLPPSRHIAAPRNLVAREGDIADIDRRLSVAEGDAFDPVRTSCRIPPVFGVLVLYEPMPSISGAE